MLNGLLIQVRGHQKDMISNHMVLYTDHLTVLCQFEKHGKGHIYVFVIFQMLPLLPPKIESSRRSLNLLTTHFPFFSFFI